MDILSRCRLCGSSDVFLLPISYDLADKVSILFRVAIGTNNDRLSLYICETCSETVLATWIFFEKVKKVQKKLIEELIDHQNTNCAQHGLITVAKPIVIVPSEENLVANPNAIDPLQESEPTKDGNEEILHDEIIATIPDVNVDDGDNDANVELEPLEMNTSGWENYPWCCECGAGTFKYYELQSHFTTAHNGLMKFACADCHMVYTTYTKFIPHVKMHRPDLKFYCDICNEKFQTGEDTETHRSKAHDNNPRPYICGTCRRTFKTHSGLANHAKCHLPSEFKNRFPCDECSKRFATKTNLLAHKRIHTGIKEHVCKQCGRGFIQKGNLESHMKTHTTTRSHICSECKKSFKTSRRLKLHSRIHSEEKSFKCNVCGKSFRERRTLQDHLRIHTGAMPFSCEFCGKNFRFKGVLATHRRQHTGERPYSCLECQHHFTNWPNYNKHMIRRHGINTSVSVRKPAKVPPTGKPQRNPPGAVLAPPQLPEGLQPQYVENSQQHLYPEMDIYILPDNASRQQPAVD